MSCFKSQKDLTSIAFNNNLTYNLVSNITSKKDYKELLMIRADGM